MKPHIGTARRPPITSRLPLLQCHEILSSGWVSTVSRCLQSTTDTSKGPGHRLQRRHFSFKTEPSKNGHRKVSNRRCEGPPLNKCNLKATGSKMLQHMTLIKVLEHVFIYMLRPYCVVGTLLPPVKNKDLKRCTGFH